MLRIRTTLLAFAAIGGLAAPASATIALQMSVFFSGSIASNFANAAGTVTNGMNWGIIVDTSGTSGVFDVGSYTPFNISTGGFLSTASGITDDYYFPASTQTLNTSAFTELGGASGGNGTITTITNVPFGGASGIATNQKFGLIWFSTNSAATGDKYGFFTNAALTIPSDSQTVDRSAPFAGADPIRSATHTILPVPEPSSFALVGAGLLILARRRTRR